MHKQVKYVISELEAMADERDRSAMANTAAMEFCNDKSMVAYLEQRRTNNLMVRNDLWQLIERIKTSTKYQKKLTKLEKLLSHE